jgi:hypothetical protein
MDPNSAKPAIDLFRITLQYVTWLLQTTLAILPAVMVVVTPPLLPKSQQQHQSMRKI